MFTNFSILKQVNDYNAVKYSEEIVDKVIKTFNLDVANIEVKHALDNLTLPLHYMTNVNTYLEGCESQMKYLEDKLPDRAFKPYVMAIVATHYLVIMTRELVRVVGGKTELPYQEMEVLEKDLGSFFDKLTLIDKIDKVIDLDVSELKKSFTSSVWGGSHPYESIGDIMDSIYDTYYESDLTEVVDDEDDD